MPLDKEFTEDLAAHLQVKRIKNKRDNSYIRLSSAGYCSRKIGYMVTGHEEQEISSHALSTFEIGHAIHNMIQTWCVDMGILKATKLIELVNGSQEVSWKGNAEGNLIDHNLKVAGHFDGITEPLVKEEIIGYQSLGESLKSYKVDPKNGKRHILEIKTITNRSKTKYQIIKNGRKVWKDIKPGEYLDEFEGIESVKVWPGQFDSLQKPKEEHIAQASMYGYLLGAEKILFIYITKDGDPSSYNYNSLLNLPVKCFSVDVDVNVVEMLKEKFKSIWVKVEAFFEALNKNNISIEEYRNLPFKEKQAYQLLLPDREYSCTDYYKDFQCTYCDYNHECYPKYFNKSDSVFKERPYLLEEVIKEDLTLV
jgi:hypothetical protein